MAYELLQQSHTHCIHIINTHIVSSTSEKLFHCHLSLYMYMSKRPTSILFFQFWETISYILHPTRMLPSAARPSSAVGLLGANQHPRSCGWRAESFWRRATEFRYLTMATWSSLRSRWTMQTNTNVSPQTPQAKERVLLQHWQFWVLFPTPMSRLNF